jgi:general secretion pathway protein L
MLKEFLSWWTRQLLDLVPDRFARRDQAMANAILATPDDREDSEPGTVLLSLRRGGQEQQAGRHMPGQAILPQLLREHPNLPLLLRLPPDSLLSRDVSLPLAAEAGYDQVLHYEMDRLTPFAASDVFWSARLLRRNKELGRIDLRLSLVPRAWLAASLDTLQAAGGRPTAIEVRGVGAEPARRIAIAHELSRGRIAQRRLLWFGAAVCAVLALAAIILPFVLQSAAMAAAERRIAALQPQVRQVEALRQRIRSGSAGIDTISAARARLGDPIGLLAALTRVLPDDTYLTDVTLRDGVITLTGQSPGAVKLIPALSADPAFVAPAFSAPVTRIESNNSDLFSIRAGIARR